MSNPLSEVTRILNAIEKGQAQRAADLLPLIYNELRGLAARKLVHERPGQTLQPTALVHEAWLRLVDSPNQSWKNRAHFFSAAAEAMRRILIERARHKNRKRRGGSIGHVDVADVEILTPAPDDQILALNEALDRFAQTEPQQAELVKLRYFVGLTIDQAAEILGISPATAKRWWAYSKAWLYTEISNN